MKWNLGQPRILPESAPGPPPTPLQPPSRPGPPWGIRRPTPGPPSIRLFKLFFAENSFILVILKDNLLILVILTENSLILVIFTENHLF